MDMTRIAPLLIALGTLIQPALAQQPKPVDKAAAQPAQRNLQEFDKRMAQLQETMKQMQAQMEKVRQTQDHRSVNGCCRSTGTRCRRRWRRCTVSGDLAARPAAGPARAWGRA